MTEKQLEIKNLIKNIPDFPQKGIIFRDITSLLKDPEGFNLFKNEVYNSIFKYEDLKFNKVVAVESRGFIIGSVVSSFLYGHPLVLARKPGKLPNKVLTKKYYLEYGDNALCIQTCDIKEGDNVLICDDVLATGGTARTTVDIVEALGGRVEACYFLIELNGLEGRKLLMEKSIKIISSIHY
jgi:adenine phosphoribosyltransferase